MSGQNKHWLDNHQNTEIRGSKSLQPIDMYCYTYDKDYSLQIQLWLI